MPSECKCNPRTPFCLERRRGRDLRCIRCANAHRYQADVKPTCACDYCWAKWRSHLEFIGAGDLGDPQTLSAPVPPPAYPPEHEAPSVVFVGHNYPIDVGSYRVQSPNSATFSVTPRGCTCLTTIKCKVHTKHDDHEYIGITRCGCDIAPMCKHNYVPRFQPLQPLPLPILTEHYRKPTPTLLVEPVQMDLFAEQSQPHRFGSSG